jgi:hypothetical protein
MRRAARYLFPLMLVVLALSLSSSGGCGGDDNCAVEQENCSAAYLEANGLTGCCEGLTCQDSPVTPGVRVCR